METIFGFAVLYLPFISSPELLGQGPEVIKLEFILTLKIKRSDWLLADMQVSQMIQAAPFSGFHIFLYFNIG